MALFSYKCEKCGEVFQYFEKAAFRTHKVDGGKLMRTPRMGTTQIKEVIDTGAMARRVEVVKKS